LPTNSWLNYVIYPIGHIFAIILAMLLFSWAMRRKFQ